MFTELDLVHTPNGQGELEIATPSNRRDPSISTGSKSESAMFGEDDDDPEQTANNKENDQLKNRCFNILPALFRYMIHYNFVNASLLLNVHLQEKVSTISGKPFELHFPKALQLRGAQRRQTRRPISDNFLVFGARLPDLPSSEELQFRHEKLGNVPYRQSVH